MIYGIYLAVQKWQEIYPRTNNILDDLSSEKDDSYLKMESSSYSSLNLQDEENIPNDNQKVLVDPEHRRKINMGNGLQSNQKVAVQDFKLQVNVTEYINASTSDFEGVH